MSENICIPKTYFIIIFAIFSVFTNAGYDDDEVNNMLDKYGYRSGGRVGHADGDMVLTNPSNITPERRNQIEGSQEAERAFNIIFERFVERFGSLNEKLCSVFNDITYIVRHAAVRI